VPDSGINLGADLYNLYKMGKHKLPTVAAVYRNAGALMSGSSTTTSTSGWQSGPRPTIQLDLAFRRSSEIDGTAKGPACTGMLDVFDTIGHALTATADNLDDTADALLLAVQVYGETDEQARCEFNRLKHENGE
jgi:hypothetical protein